MGLNIITSILVMIIVFCNFIMLYCLFKQLKELTKYIDIHIFNKPVEVEQSQKVENIFDKLFKSKPVIVKETDDEEVFSDMSGGRI